VKNEIKPHEKRCGWLKNGNPPGDFTKAPRCGAKTRQGTPCQCPAMTNGRCRLRGGKSTGAPKGNKNALKTGKHTAKAKAYRRYMDVLLRESKELVERM